MSAKRYFWLKLKEDFFEDDAIEWLEEQKNGKEYALFYLKLCLKSLKSDGLLMRKVGNILVPYDAAKLAEITRTDVDTVIVALELLKKIGLVEIADTGAIFMTQLSAMVGSETDKAAYMRRLRARKALETSQENDAVTLLPACGNNEATNVTAEYRDKSIEYRDRDIEIEGGMEGGQAAPVPAAPAAPPTPEKGKKKKPKKGEEKEPVEKHKYGEYKHVLLSDDEHSKLVVKFGAEKTAECIKFLDEYIEEKRYKSASHYLAILRWVADAVSEKETKRGGYRQRGGGRGGNVGPNGIPIDQSKNDLEGAFK